MIKENIFSRNGEIFRNVSDVEGCARRVGECATDEFTSREIISKIFRRSVKVRQEMSEAFADFFKVNL